MNGEDYQNMEMAADKSARHHERNRPDSLAFTHEVHLIHEISFPFLS